MTVCIGVLSAWGTGAARIFLASDRMLSRGDVEYEPPRPKVEYLTASIVALIAGDAATHTSVADAVRRELIRRIQIDPSVWIPVEDAAELYRATFVAWRQRQLERDVLEPLSLSWKSLALNSSGHSADSLAEINRLVRRYSDHYDQSFSAIVAGIDGTEGQERAHLFCIRGGTLTCENRLGFVAIGSGEQHAHLQLMLQRYTPAATAAEALVLLGIAKRAAQVAPGVGDQTDLFVIGPKLGTADRLKPEIEKMLDTSLVLRSRALSRTELRTIARVQTGLNEMFRASRAGEQDTPPNPDA